MKREDQGARCHQRPRRHVQDDDEADGHGAVPARAGRPAAARPRRHRAQGGELHGLHAVRAPVPRLVHLHRGPQGAAPAAPRGRRAAQRQHPRPLRHRLRALHVLRHLRRGVPVRRAVLEPRVRVLRAAHRRPAARQGQARRVDGDRARARAARARRRSEGQEVRRGRARTSPSGSSRPRWCSARSASCARKNVVHAALYLVVVLAGAAAQYILLGAGVRRLGAGARLHRRRDRAVPVRHHAHPGADAARRDRSTTTSAGRPRSSRCSCSACSAALLVDAFGGDKIDARRAPIAHGRRSRDAIFRAYLVPVRGRRRAPARRARSAPSSWRGRTDRCCSTSSSSSARSCSAPASTACSPASNAVLVLMSDRADAQRGQHQPGRLRRRSTTTSPARCSPCSSSRSPPPRSASAWRSCC